MKTNLIGRILDMIGITKNSQIDRISEFVEKTEARQKEYLMPWDIKAVRFPKQFCTVRIINGTPRVFTPKGEELDAIIDLQTGFRQINSRRGVGTVTITMAANLCDSGLDTPYPGHDRTLSEQLQISESGHPTSTYKYRPPCPPRTDEYEQRC